MQGVPSAEAPLVTPVCTLRPYGEASVQGQSLTPSQSLQQLDPIISQYRDRRFEGSQEAFEHALRTSTTVYVGNLSFFTTEEQIYEVSAQNSAQL